DAVPREKFSSKTQALLIGLSRKNGRECADTGARRFGQGARRSNGLAGALKAGERCKGRAVENQITDGILNAAVDPGTCLAVLCANPLVPGTGIRQTLDCAGTREAANNLRYFVEAQKAY